MDKTKALMDDFETTVEELNNKGNVMMTFAFMKDFLRAQSNNVRTNYLFLSPSKGMCCELRLYAC